MSELFQIKGEDFIRSLQSEKVDRYSNVSLHDIFEVYVELANQSTNALDKNMLRKLIFKQFKQYGDFDEQVRETAKTVCDITTTTGEVIDAIKNDNTDTIKTAYDKLQGYNSRMQELENGMLIDENTTLFNRQYLLSKVLDQDLKFQEDGILFYLHIEAIEDLDEQYGSIVVKGIIKKFATDAKKNLNTAETPLINYDHNEFLIVCSEKAASDVRNKLKIFKKALSIKKFKIPGDKTLSFSFDYDETAYKAALLFEGTLNKLKGL